MHGAITLSGTPSLGDFGRTAAVMALLHTTICQRNAPRLQAWAVPASLATTGESWLVSFPPLINNMLKLCLNSVVQVGACHPHYQASAQGATGEWHIDSSSITCAGQAGRLESGVI